jgi:hypothetical protein
MASAFGTSKGSERRVRLPRLLVFVAGIVCTCGAARLPAQSGSTAVEQPDRLRGTVVNSLTHEPIGRALVFSPDNRFAAMTDDRGRFEFTFAPGERRQTGGVSSGSNFQAQSTFPTAQMPQPGTDRPGQLMARKNGFLPLPGRETVLVRPEQRELTISMMPEARVIGHVILPSADGSDSMQVELYRRQVREGREHWESAGTAMSRADGEFRFADLPAGSYKLFTHELMDRDPLTSDPRGPLFGYPPIYYPAAADFATSAVIRLSPGETFQASLSPTKREYYRVKLGIANGGPGLQEQIQVWPQGNEGPGYSLGYDYRDGSIRGMLPNGTYTLEVSTYGPNAMTGTSNITVAGTALAGPAITLVPSSSIAVRVREEFQRTQGAATMTVGDASGQMFTASARRPNYLQVSLVPAEEFGQKQGVSLRPPVGPEDDSLVLENVAPGRYHVRVDTSIGFVSSTISGETDLQQHLLVVGPGAAPPPIEVTVRDDGAQVEGTIEGIKNDQDRGAEFFPPGQAQGSVYFVPMGSGGPLKEAWVSAAGKFQAEQLAPGTYRVLAFDRPQQDLEYASDEVMRRFDSKAQVISVVPGQKVQLRLSLIAASE